MPRKWLQQAIESEYLPVIRSLKDTPDGRQQAEALYQSIRQSWYDRGSRSLTQQQGVIDETRRRLKDELGEDHWILDVIGFTTEEYTELNNIKQNRVAERNEATQQIDNPDAIVATAARLMEKADWASIAAGLAVTTGRRIAELLSTAQFEKKSQWSVTFSGALKRRGESQQLSFEIPTLVVADRVIQALKRLRTELPQATEMTPTEINGKYESAVARVCDQTFTDLVSPRDGKESLYTHLFRAVYATIATFWYCPPTVEATEFRAAIQGHYALLDQKSPELRRSIAASRHYSDYEISDQEIAKYNGKRKGIKLGISGIQPIEQFEKALEPKQTAERQTRTSVRIWQSDKTRLDQMLEKFEGTQPQKFSALLDWLEEIDHLIEESSIATTEISESIPTAAETAQLEATPGTDEFSSHPENIPMQSQTTQNAELDETYTLPMPTPLESRIDRLVSTMEKFLQWQLESANQAAKPPRVARIPKPEKSTVAQLEKTDKVTEADDQKQPAPRQRARASQTTERINHAIDKIFAFNNEPGRKHSEKWAIGINTLKAFVGSQEAIVGVIGGKNRKGETVVGERQKEIERHHQQHQINPAKHNLDNHRGKGKITEVISVQEMD